MQKKINRGVLFLAVINFIFCGLVSAEVVEVVDRVVAIVNNDIVTLYQLNKETEPYKKKIEATSYSDDQKQEMLKDINEKILNSLIDQSLTHQEAKKYRIDISENEIDRAVENILESKSMSMDDFLKALGQERLEIEEYRKNLKNQILHTKLINYAVKSKVIIMESDIIAYYKNHKEKYSGIQKYHLRNILMNSEDRIKEVKEKLDNKEDFTTLAKKYSIASNAQDGGDLGLFDIKNFPENIKAKILKLKKDQFTDVISTVQGFQIFYIEDIILKGGKTYDESHDEIHAILYNEQVEEKFEKWLKSLKQKAHIKIML